MKKSVIMKKSSILYLSTFILSLLMVLPFNSKAQISDKDGADSLHLVITAKPMGDSIILRWAPKNPIAWAMSRRKGYTLYRFGIASDGTMDSTQLTREPIRPMSLKNMKAWAEMDKARMDDKYLALTAQALYDKNAALANPEDISTDFIKSIQQKSDIFNMKYFMAITSADLSRNAATAQGLRFVDKNVEKGKIYYYAVISDTSDKNYTIRGAMVEVINAPEAPMAIQGLSAYGLDHKVELQWNRIQEGNYTAYFIERSDDGGKSFKRLNETPYYATYDPNLDKGESETQQKVQNVLKDFQVYTDSIPKNYFNYYYRIIGIDAFADQSLPSEPTIVQGKDQTPPNPVRIDSVVNTQKNHLKIFWSMPDPSPDLAGYYISRSSDAKGPFIPLTKKIIPKNVHTYVDSSASALESNYYVVLAADTSQNVSYGFPVRGYLKDSIPPAPPIGVGGVMDTLGNVYLTWDRNKEPDLEGYRVYISYNQGGNYTIITPYVIKENFLTHKINLNSLDRRVYFKVVAVDKNNNPSNFSQPAQIEKYITIPPSAPVADRIYAVNDKIKIDFIGSSSMGVWGHEIYRKTKDNETWDTIARVAKNYINNRFTYTDSTALPNITYVYSASALDSTGLLSEPSFPVQINIYKVEVLKPVTELSTNIKGDAIELSWKYSAANKNFYYIIYRSENENDLEMWNSANADQMNVKDYQVSKGKTYRYAIVVKEKDGDGRSILSKEVKVTYQ